MAYPCIASHGPTDRAQSGHVAQQPKSHHPPPRESPPKAPEPPFVLPPPALVPGADHAGVLLAEEFGPNPQWIIGDHAPNLARLWAAASAMSPPPAAWEEAALRGIARQMRWQAEKRSVAEIAPSSSEAHIRQLERETRARTETERVLRAQVHEAHAALNGERAARESLARELADAERTVATERGACAGLRHDCAQMHMAIQKKDREMAQVAHALDAERGAKGKLVERCQREAALSLSEFQRAQQIELAVRAELAAEMEAMRRIVEESAQQNQALAEAAGLDNEALRLAAASGIEEITEAWRRRAAVAENVGAVQKKQMASLRDERNAMDAELQLVHALLQCEDETPAPLRGDARARGTWRDPSQVCGEDERRALRANQQADRLFRAHVIHGHPVGQAVCAALGRAIGVDPARRLSAEFRVGDKP